MKSSQILAVDKASLRYTDGSRTTYALRDVSASLAPGRFYGIMGPSGSGKSSLLYILSGLKRATDGTARFGDFVYRERRESDVVALRRTAFGFVFQQPFLLSYLTAAENCVVAAPRQDKAAWEKARSYLSDLGLGAMENKKPGELSGGERQRVAVVRAMMNDPEVIFADEPTAALDHTNGFRVMEALARWRERGTVVVVTHDAEMLAGADETLILRDGALKERQTRASASELRAAVAQAGEARGEGG